MEKYKNYKILLLEYCILFLCLCAVFFFMIPQSDVFLFARNCENDLQSIAEYSLNYGNGRFLGNFIGVFFSHYFEYAWIIVAATIAVTVALLNGLLFAHSKYSLFFLAVLIVFPCSGVFSECYTLFASFTNFFMPITFIVFSLYIYNKLLNDKGSVFSKILLNILLFVVSVSSCLFSENTSIVAFITAFFLSVYSFIKYKKLKIFGVNYIISAAIGTAAMFTIPLITGTSQKMDHYREIETGVFSIISNALASFVRFSDVFNSFILVLVLLSIALIFCVLNQNVDRRFKTFCVSFLAAYPVFCLLMKSFGAQSKYLAVMHIFEMLLLVVYLLVFAFILFKTEDKKQRIIYLCFCIVLLSAIAPMLVVNQYGYRTNLTTYFILLVFSIYLLKSNAQQKITLSSLHQYFSKNVVSAIMFSLFVFTCGYISVQMVYNFNIYTVRSEYIIQELNADSEEIEVPLLPFSSVIIEDEWPNIISDVADEAKTKIKIADISSCENAQQYEKIFDDSIVENIRLALSNDRYKNSLEINNSVKN